MADKTDKLRQGLENIANSIKQPWQATRPVRSLGRRFFGDQYDADEEEAYAAAEAMGCGKYGFDE